MNRHQSTRCIKIVFLSKHKKWNIVCYKYDLIKYANKKNSFTFSDTILLFPLKSSGAIHGKVPLTPPDTKVCCLTFDSPRSPIWSEVIKLGKVRRQYPPWRVSQKDKIVRGKAWDQTLQIGRCGSLMFTSRFSHFRSKWTIFFPCKYSMPNAASMANITLFRRSIVLLNCYILDFNTEEINEQTILILNNNTYLFSSGTVWETHWP
jgi:hypothetical protein